MTVILDGSCPQYKCKLMLDGMTAILVLLKRVFVVLESGLERP
jgi:hypothetical protein